MTRDYLGLNLLCNRGFYYCVELLKSISCGKLKLDYELGNSYYHLKRFGDTHKRIRKDRRNSIGF